MSTEHERRGWGENTKSVRCPTRQIGMKVFDHKHYRSSRTASLDVSPLLGAEWELDPSFASFLLSLSSREVAGLPSPDLGDLHGAGIGLIGSMGT